MRLFLICFHQSHDFPRWQLSKIFDELAQTQLLLETKRFESIKDSFRVFGTMRLTGDLNLKNSEKIVHFFVF